MKIVVLTPQDHFHSPIILRELGLKRKGDEIIIVTTPKLGIKGSVFYRLSRLIKQSGIDYLVSLMIAKICYIFLGIIERFIILRPFELRQFISVDEVISNLHLQRLKLTNINSSKNVAIVKNLKPDIIISVFFNQIVKEGILSIPRYGAINIHPSYLPRYRGISPCFWVLANNESNTGITIHYLTRGIDEGLVLRQEEISIMPQDTFFSLYRKCAIKGAEILSGVLDMAIKCEKGITQIEKEANYFSDITPKSVRRFRKYQRKFAWLA